MLTTTFNKNINIMMNRFGLAVLLLLCNLTTITTAWSYDSQGRNNGSLKQQQEEQKKVEISTRRDVLQKVATSNAVGFAFVYAPSRYSVAAPAYADFPSLLEKVTKARDQLLVVPKLIDEGKWDAVRAVLIEPPLADCWAKTSRPLLSKYAEALGDAGGDELAALEAKEEAVSHLRYLDMAVYNNVFNPIATEGTTGATKALIRSYYEDPINEYKASKAALDELVNLSKEL